MYDQPEEREGRLSSLEEMTNAIGAYEDDAKQPDLTGFLSDIALSGRELGNEKDKLAKQNAVWLLTMHAAKGLEFPFVFMVGMEDGHPAAQPQRQEWRRRRHRRRTATLLCRHHACPGIADPLAGSDATKMGKAAADHAQADFSTRSPARRTIRTSTAKPPTKRRPAHR